MALACWLFVKGSESIWVERPGEHLIIVAGPGAAKEERTFIDEASVQAFQVALAEKLTEAGWFLWGVNRERRTSADRRTARRDTPDRRQGSRLKAQGSTTRL
jgi:hypothetical protein